jgi:predicted  nucleic acid-binding Zn-ribbon protein
MDNQFSVLIALDALENEILGLHRSKGVLPKQIMQFQARIDIQQTSLTQQKAKISELEIALENSKERLESEKKGLKHSNERLSSISTNREYDAVHSEIISHNENIKSLENLIIEQMEAQELLQANLPELDSLLKQAQDKFAPEINRLQKNLDNIDSQIAEIRIKARELKNVISKDILSYYTKIFESKKALLISGKQRGVVSVFKAGDTSCSICSETLTRTKIQVVKRNDHVVFCDDCGSILVWENA